MAKRKKDNEGPESENLNQSDDSADNFGLPDIDYKPLDRTETPAPEPILEEREEIVEEVHEEHNEYVDDDEESPSKAPVIITVVILLVLAVGGFLAWKYWYVPRAEKAKLEAEAVAQAEKAKQEEAARLAREKEEAEQKRLADEAAAKAKPVEGTIELLSAPTHKYYVVLSSDIDDDLIMDYAKKLSAKGISTKIVPPFGTSKFYRLAMGESDTYTDAQGKADASKGELGGSLWVMRY